MSAFASTTGSSNNRTIAANDCAVPSSGNDGISSLTWSPTANFLVSSNWDGGVRCWEVREQQTRVEAAPKAQVNHENQAPVLCTAFSADGSTVFSGGLDNAVRMWPLNTAPPQVAQQIGVHEKPVKSVFFIPSTNLVVSGGWDRKLNFWDARTPTPVGTLDVGERVFDMDLRQNLLVVANAGKQIVTYDVSGQPRHHSTKDSPLKYQPRCISAFTDCTGFAVGSIEGRVGIHYLQKVPGKDSFAFKCHRQDSNVFAVNAICFHNQFGTFATAGSDGVVNFWDKDKKQRLKAFPPTQRPISCANFNASGNLFAYASSYDWSKGSKFYAPGTPNEIFIHYTPDEEIKPKDKKSLKGR